MKGFQSIAFFISSVILSCSKPADVPQTIETEIPTGVFIGKFDNPVTDKTFNQFKIEIIKNGNNLYSIREVDNGGLPEIVMEVKQTKLSFVFYRIPEQSTGGRSFSGTGGASGHDAQYFGAVKSFYFGIAYTDEPNEWLTFNGAQ